MKAANECGCWIDYNPGHRDRIEFCPLHATAGEMSEVLKRIIDISYMVEEPMGDRLESICDNARFTIAKVERLREPRQGGEE